MSQFLASPLRALDRIYHFLEGTPPKQVELGLPVQLVHDVSRMSELGVVAQMGYFISGGDNVHGAPSTVESSFDPYTEVSYLLPNISDLWVWLIQPWMTASANSMTSFSLTLGYAPLGDSIVRRDRLLWAATAIFAIYDQAVTPATFPFGATAALARPVLISPGSTCRIQSVSAGIVTARIEGLFWVGPMGLEPPFAG